MLSKMNKILILEARNFGDAVIKTGTINSIGEQYPKLQIDLLTKEQFMMIYEKNPYLHNIYYSSFPIANPKSLDIRNLIATIMYLRKRNYDACIDTVGDFREIMINKLINPRINITVKRQGKHPFNQLIRQGCRNFANKILEIPLETINIYETQDYILNKLGVRKKCLPNLFIGQERNETLSELCKNIISIHPFASQDCKMWDVEKWIKLIRLLIRQGFIVWIFCARDEERWAQKQFESILKNQQVQLVAESLKEFFEDLSKSDVLVGLDSLSIHAANALGVPSIMLCGANDYRLWQPPTSIVFSHGDRCPHHPCFNRPKCLGSSTQYVCIKDITVEEVYGGIVDIINSKGA